ncbi:MAG: hypothetical protein KKC50_04220, partial [Candidatus Omnitrophica bacterium]|nr:hypothetical protein [Candidatus Omnitrophota bacterium]
SGASITIAGKLITSVAAVMWKDGQTCDAVKYTQAGLIRLAGINAMMPEGVTGYKVFQHLDGDNKGDYVVFADAVTFTDTISGAKQTVTEKMVLMGDDLTNMESGLFACADGKMMKVSIVKGEINAGYWAKPTETDIKGLTNAKAGKLIAGTAGISNYVVFADAATSTDTIKGAKQTVTEKMVLMGDDLKNMRSNPITHADGKVMAVSIVNGELIFARWELTKVYDEKTKITRTYEGNKLVLTEKGIEVKGEKGKLVVVSGWEEIYTYEKIDNSDEERISRVVKNYTNGDVETTVYRYGDISNGADYLTVDTMVQRSEKEVSGKISLTGVSEKIFSFIDSLDSIGEYSAGNRMVFTAEKDYANWQLKQDASCISRSYQDVYIRPDGTLFTVKAGEGEHVLGRETTYKEGAIVEINITDADGQFTRILASKENGKVMPVFDGHGKLQNASIIEGNRKTIYSKGKVVSQIFSAGKDEIVGKPSETDEKTWNYTRQSDNAKVYPVGNGGLFLANGESETVRASELLAFLKGDDTTAKITGEDRDVTITLNADANGISFSSSRIIEFTTKEFMGVKLSEIEGSDTAIMNGHIMTDGKIEYDISPVLEESLLIKAGLIEKLDGIVWGGASYAGKILCVRKDGDLYAYKHAVVIDAKTGTELEIKKTSRVSGNDGIDVIATVIKGSVDLGKTLRIFEQTGQPGPGGEQSTAHLKKDEEGNILALKNSVIMIRYDKTEDSVVAGVSENTLLVVNESVENLSAKNSILIAGKEVMSGKWLVRDGKAHIAPVVGNTGKYIDSLVKINEVAGGEDNIEIIGQFTVVKEGEELRIKGEYFDIEGNALGEKHEGATKTENGVLYEVVRLPSADKGISQYALVNKAAFTGMLEKMKVDNLELKIEVDKNTSFTRIEGNLYSINVTKDGYNLTGTVRASTVLDEETGQNQYHIESFEDVTVTIHGTYEVAANTDADGNVTATLVVEGRESAPVKIKIKNNEYTTGFTAKVSGEFKFGEYILDSGSLVNYTADKGWSFGNGAKGTYCPEKQPAGFANLDIEKAEWEMLDEDGEYKKGITFKFEVQEGRLFLTPLRDIRMTSKPGEKLEETVTIYKEYEYKDKRIISSLTINDKNQLVLLDGVTRRHVLDKKGASGGEAPVRSEITDIIISTDSLGNTWKDGLVEVVNMRDTVGKVTIGDIAAGQHADFNGYRFTEKNEGLVFEYISVKEGGGRQYVLTGDNNKKDGRNVQLLKYNGMDIRGEDARVFADLEVNKAGHTVTEIEGTPFIMTDNAYGIKVSLLSRQELDVIKAYITKEGLKYDKTELSKYIKVPAGENIPGIGESFKLTCNVAGQKQLLEFTLSDDGFLAPTADTIMTIRAICFFEGIEGQAKKAFIEKFDALIKKSGANMKDAGSMAKFLKSAEFKKYIADPKNEQILKSGQSVYYIAADAESRFVLDKDNNLVLVKGAKVGVWGHDRLDGEGSGTTTIVLDGSKTNLTVYTPERENKEKYFVAFGSLGVDKGQDVWVGSGTKYTVAKGKEWVYGTNEKTGKDQVWSAKNVGENIDDAVIVPPAETGKAIFTQNIRAKQLDTVFKGGKDGRLQVESGFLKTEDKSGATLYINFVKGNATWSMYEPGSPEDIERRGVQYSAYITLKGIVAAKKEISGEIAKLEAGNEKDKTYAERLKGVLKTAEAMAGKNGKYQTADEAVDGKWGKNSILMQKTTGVYAECNSYMQQTSIFDGMKKYDLFMNKCVAPVLGQGWNYSVKDKKFKKGNKTISAQEARDLWADTIMEGSTAMGAFMFALEQAKPGGFYEDIKFTIDMGKGTMKAKIIGKDGRTIGGTDDMKIEISQGILSFKGTVKSYGVNKLEKQEEGGRTRRGMADMNNKFLQGLVGLDGTFDISSEFKLDKKGEDGRTRRSMADMNNKFLQGLVGLDGTFDISSEFKLDKKGEDGRKDIGYEDTGGGLWVAISYSKDGPSGGKSPVIYGELIVLETRKVEGRPDVTFLRVDGDIKFEGLQLRPFEGRDSFVTLEGVTFKMPNSQAVGDKSTPMRYESKDGKWHGERVITGSTIGEALRESAENIREKAGWAYGKVKELAGMDYTIKRAGLKGGVSLIGAFYHEVQAYLNEKAGFGAYAAKEREKGIALKKEWSEQRAIVLEKSGCMLGKTETAAHIIIKDGKHLIEYGKHKVGETVARIQQVKDIAVALWSAGNAGLNEKLGAEKGAAFWEAQCLSSLKKQEVHGDAAERHGAGARYAAGEIKTLETIRETIPIEDIKIVKTMGYHADDLIGDIVGTFTDPEQRGKVWDSGKNLLTTVIFKAVQYSADLEMFKFAVKAFICEKIGVDSLAGFYRKEEKRMREFSGDLERVGSDAAIALYKSADGLRLLETPVMEKTFAGLHTAVQGVLNPVEGMFLGLGAVAAIIASQYYSGKDKERMLLWANALKTRAVEKYLETSIFRYLGDHLFSPGLSSMSQQERKQAIASYCKENGIINAKGNVVEPFTNTEIPWESFSTDWMIQDMAELGGALIARGEIKEGILLCLIASEAATAKFYVDMQVLGGMLRGMGAVAGGGTKLAFGAAWGARVGRAFNAVTHVGISAPFWGGVYNSVCEAVGAYGNYLAAEQVYKEAFKYFGENSDLTKNAKKTFEEARVLSYQKTSVFVSTQLLPLIRAGVLIGTSGKMRRMQKAEIAKTGKKMSWKEFVRELRRSESEGIASEVKKAAVVLPLCPFISPYGIFTGAAIKQYRVQSRVEEAAKKGINAEEGVTKKAAREVIDGKQSQLVVNIDYMKSSKIGAFLWSALGVSSGLERHELDEKKSYVLALRKLGIVDVSWVRKKGSRNTIAYTDKSGKKFAVKYENGKTAQKRYQKTMSILGWEYVNEAGKTGKTPVDKADKKLKAFEKWTKKGKHKFFSEDGKNITMQVAQELWKEYAQAKIEVAVKGIQATEAITYFERIQKIEGKAKEINDKGKSSTITEVGALQKSINKIVQEVRTKTGEEWIEYKDFKKIVATRMGQIYADAGMKATGGKFANVVKLFMKTNAERKLGDVFKHLKGAEYQDLKITSVLRKAVDDMYSFRDLMRIHENAGKLIRKRFSKRGKGGHLSPADAELKLYGFEGQSRKTGKRFEKLKKTKDINSQWKMLNTARERVEPRENFRSLDKAFKNLSDKTVDNLLRGPPGKRIKYVLDRITGKSHLGKLSGALETKLSKGIEHVLKHTAKESRVRKLAGALETKLSERRKYILEHAAGKSHLGKLAGALETKLKSSKGEMTVADLKKIADPKGNANPADFKKDFRQILVLYKPSLPGDFLDVVTVKPAAKEIDRVIDMAQGICNKNVIKTGPSSTKHSAKLAAEERAATKQAAALLAEMFSDGTLGNGWKLETQNATARKNAGDLYQSFLMGNKIIAMASGKATKGALTDVVAGRVARKFAYIKSLEPGWKWRVEQIAMAYISAIDFLFISHGVTVKEVIGLPCGGGKEAAEAVGLTVAYDLNPRGIYIFCTSTSSNALQMYNNPVMQNALRRVGPGKINLVTEGAGKMAKLGEGIHIMSYTDFLGFALEGNIPRGTVLAADELQFALAMAPLIKAAAHRPSEKMSSRKRELAMEEINSVYQEIFNKVKEALGSIRNIEKGGKQVNHSYEFAESGKLYEKMLKNEGAIRKFLEKTGKAEFKKIVDAAATALKYKNEADYHLDYSLFGDKFLGYSVAEATSGGRQAGTMFSEKHLALFVVMKHSTSGADMRLKIDTLHKKDRGRMDFKKALKGVAGWVAASGTVKKTGAVIKELGAERIMLKMEPSLKVHKGVIDIGVMGNGRQVVDIMTGKLKRGTTRLCIYTEKDGGNVRKAYSEFKENGLKGVKIELVLGRDMGVFKKEIARISREIQQDPTLKRAVFVQGLGDGSNIAKMPDWFTCRLKGWKGSNRPRACLIKGDLAPSDFVAQVAQRLNLEKANMGGKGRMKGSFIQLISLNDPWLTGQQRAELKNAKNQDAKKQSKIILRIQEEMLTDINARNVCQIYEAKGEHTAAEVSRVVQYFRERAAWSANRQNDSGSYDIASAAKTLDISGENGMDMDYMENFMAERGWVNPAGYLTQEAQVFVSQAAVLLNTDDNGKGELKLMGIDLGTNNTLENVFKVMDTMTTNGVIDFSNTGERGVGRLISLGSVINGLNNMMTETNKITLDMNDLTKIFTSFNETEKLGVILSKLEGSGAAVSRFREPLKASFELKEKARDGMIKFEALATEKAELE